MFRFQKLGARYGFTLDEDLKTAAASEAVRTALENKVSRERIGHEVRAGKTSYLHLFPTIVGTSPLLINLIHVSWLTG
jgi:hypothetical protein